MTILRFFFFLLISYIYSLIIDLILFLYYSRKAHYDCSRCKMWTCDGSCNFCSKRR